MNLFKNREEHENYVNSILNKQKNTLPDKLLHVFLWQKIKFIFQYDETVVEQFVDNDDSIIILKDDNGIMIIGYLQIDKKWDSKSSYDSNLIITTLKDFIFDITNLAREKEILAYRFIIVSTYKLSKYQSTFFSQLSKDVSYFYLADIDANNNLLLDLNRDEEIIELIESDVNLDRFINYMKINSEESIKNWQCEICGGNNFTGCQFYDPTECPKFS
jgi:hypothetical protein